MRNGQFRVQFPLGYTRHGKYVLETVISQLFSHSKSVKLFCQWNFSEKFKSSCKFALEANQQEMVEYIVIKSSISPLHSAAIHTARLYQKS